MLLEILILVALAAFIMEMIDAGLGLGYGTVLSPLLIVMGFPPLQVVPSLLFSQAIGGFTAAVSHSRHKNADFKPKTTDLGKIKAHIKEHGIAKSYEKGLTNDLKIVMAITVLGVLATIISVLVAINIPSWMMKGYIGVLVLVIGILLLLGVSFKFSIKKMVGVGLLASFNKGLSGGGFGPVTTGGQVIGGNKHKSSIGCTTLSEAPICIAGFLTYILANGLEGYELLIALSIGALLGAPLGAFLTSRVDTEKLKTVVAVSIIALGAWTIINLL